VESQFCSAGYVIGGVRMPGACNWTKCVIAAKLTVKGIIPTFTIAAGSPSETCQKAIILKREWIKSE
jgi:hypothetical protein